MSSGNKITFKIKSNMNKSNSEIDNKWNNLGIKFLDINEKFNYRFVPIILSNFNSRHKMYNVADNKLRGLMLNLQSELDNMVCSYYPSTTYELNTDSKIRSTKVFYEGRFAEKQTIEKFVKNNNNKKKINKLEKEEKEFVDEFVAELQEFINYLDTDYYDDFKIAYKNPERKINKILDGINDTIRKIKRYI